MAATQEKVDSMIVHISQAETPNSVTNEQVALILDFFNQTVKYVENTMKGNLSKAEQAASNAAEAASNLARSYNEWHGRISVLTQVLTGFTLHPAATAITANMNYASLKDGHTTGTAGNFLSGATEALAGVMTAQQVKDLNQAIKDLRWIDAIKTFMGVTSSDPTKPGESALVKRVSDLATVTTNLTQEINKRALIHTINMETTGGELRITDMETAIKAIVEDLFITIVQGGLLALKETRLLRVNVNGHLLLSEEMKRNGAATLEAVFRIEGDYLGGPSYPGTLKVRLHADGKSTAEYSPDYIEMADDEAMEALIKEGNADKGKIYYTVEEE